MNYVDYNNDGDITAVYACKQREGQLSTNLGIADHIKFKVKNGKVVDISTTKEYKDKQKEKEQEVQDAKRISRRQMVFWLIDNKNLDRDGILSEIDSIVDANVRKKAETSFLDATFFEYGNPFVSIIGSALDLTSEEIITMFDEAKNL